MEKLARDCGLSQPLHVPSGPIGDTEFDTRIIRSISIDKGVINGGDDGERT